MAPRGARRPRTETRGCVVHVRPPPLPARHPPPRRDDQTFAGVRATRRGSTRVPRPPPRMPPFDAAGRSVSNVRQRVEIRAGKRACPAAAAPHVCPRPRVERHHGRARWWRHRVARKTKKTKKTKTEPAAGRTPVLAAAAGHHVTPPPACLSRAVWGLTATGAMAARPPRWTTGAARRAVGEGRDAAGTVAQPGARAGRAPCRAPRPRPHPRGRHPTPQAGRAKQSVWGAPTPGRTRRGGGR